ncbi:MAG: elongation factor P [Candidatus Pacebacteria bacterium]|nr:elongation factor P [Candidatus Paceibacterota bacterium]
MLAYNELKKGMVFVMNGEPYEVLDYEFLRMQQRKPVAKTKLKNLITGKITEQSFHSSESFDEAEIEKKLIKYLYNSKEEFWFCEVKDASKRFALKEELVGNPGKFLKANTEVNAIKFGERIIGIDVPVKMDLKVKEAPPGYKGDTATGGTKQIILETGAVINAPLFINEGDIVKVNTQTGDYYERVEKCKE